MVRRLGGLFIAYLMAVACSSGSSGGTGANPFGETGGASGAGSTSADASSGAGGAGSGGFISATGSGTSAGGAVGAGGTGTSGGTGAGGGTPATGGAPPVNVCGVVFKDCDGDSANGCETNLQTDPANCGACGTACTGAANASPVCFVGACDYACVSGYGDCDAEPGNGCEADLLTDPANCGTCGKDCGGKACQNGGCQCASDSATPQRSPLDIYVLFDQSGSMGQDVTGGTKWNVIKGALQTFVQSPGAAGITVGLGYFPYIIPGAPTSCWANADCGSYGPCNGAIILFGVNILPGACALADACQPGTYIPEVPMGLLPGNATPIITSLNAHNPGGGTPTYPALVGAYKYATDWAIQNPTHKTIVVLASDGDPTGCDGNLNNVNNISSTIVTQALNQVPSIMTFVIGVGSSLTSLNQIAAAGGTNQAFIVDTAGSDPGGQFLAAMQAIQGSSLLGCSYSIPSPPNGGTPDYTKVNVQLKPTTGTPTLLKGLPSSGSCDASGGWYYDNPSAPTQIILCSASCDTLTQTQGMSIEVLLGCGTNG